jgi:hypothetical protein
MLFLVGDEEITFYGGDPDDGEWYVNVDGSLTPVVPARVAAGNEMLGIEWLRWNGRRWRVQSVRTRSRLV